MSTRSSFLCLVTTGLLLAALPVWAKPHNKPMRTTPKNTVEDTVTIENTGSTNTTGYQIVVTAGGSASYRESGARGAARNSLSQPRVQALSKDITTKLFTDLAAAGPLASLPARHGMRSVSFGTATYITYQGQRSPDLTYPANPQAQALRDDVLAITRSMHVTNNSRFPIPTLP